MSQKFNSYTPPSDRPTPKAKRSKRDRNGYQQVDGPATTSPSVHGHEGDSSSFPYQSYQNTGSFSVQTGGRQPASDRQDEAEGGTYVTANQGVEGYRYPEGSKRAGKRPSQIGRYDEISDHDHGDDDDDEFYQNSAHPSLLNDGGNTSSRYASYQHPYHSSVSVPPATTLGSGDGSSMEDGVYGRGAHGGGGGGGGPDLGASGPAGSSSGGGRGMVRVNRYETALPVRADIEAALTYALGLVTGVAFLILEQKNDYVRFHAWQSCLASAAYFVLLIVVGLISTVLYWIMFAAGLFGLATLAYRAYVDAATLTRYKLPYLGDYADYWVNME